MLAVFFAFTLSSPARAQETVFRMEIDAPVEPIPAGQEFEVRMLVDNVEHLASFQFTITYDPKRLKFQRVDDMATFLASGERNVGCGESPYLEKNTVDVSCFTLNAPVCLGGPEGVSGSGLLGRVVFKSKGGGLTTLELTKTLLLLDDVEPCASEGRPVEISHRRGENATVELIGGGGPPWVIIGPIIGVVVLLLLAGGFAGYLWYQRRGTGTTP